MKKLEAERGAATTRLFEFKFKECGTWSHVALRSCHLSLHGSDSNVARSVVYSVEDRRDSAMVVVDEGGHGSFRSVKPNHFLISKHYCPPLHLQSNIFFRGY